MKNINVFLSKERLIFIISENETNYAVDYDLVTNTYTIGESVQMLFEFSPQTNISIDGKYFFTKFQNKSGEINLGIFSLPELNTIATYELSTPAFIYRTNKRKNIHYIQLPSKLISGNRLSSSEFTFDINQNIPTLIQTETFQIENNLFEIKQNSIFRNGQLVISFS